MVSLFDRESPAQLHIEESGVEDRTGVSLHDISYDGESAGRVRAYLVEPATGGLTAGLVFVHPGPGDRTNYLDEAVQCARLGATSLVVDAPWSQGMAWVEHLMDPQDAQRQFIRDAQELRRGVDLLLAQPRVDGRRIGYVGHSYGAIFGGILAGVEKRIKAFVLMAGVGSFTDVALINMPDLQGEALETRRRLMDPIDPIHYVGQAAPSPLFFQLPRSDEFFPPALLESYAGAGSQPKEVRWYDADHYSVNGAGRDDRVAWMSEQLSLGR